MTQIFHRYLTKEPNANGVVIDKLIFNEESLDPETGMISDNLASINKLGFLTVNSQPCVNCAPSNDPKIGKQILQVIISND